MAYHIAVDSCTDLNDELRKEDGVVRVPLTLIVGKDQIVDDETFDQAEFLKKVAACPEAPSSACPSPEAYMAAYGFDEEDAYGITLSAELSGSYNSAMLASNLMSEQHPAKHIHIFNSKSAASGQTLILMKLLECLKAGKSFDAVVAEVEAYIESQQTMFVLESMETLRKNGRLSNLKAAVVNVLNIKPVMGSTPEGLIVQLDMGRGMKKALQKMAIQVGKFVKQPEDRIFGISHCNCYERAVYVKEEIQKLYNFKDVIIVDTAGVASMYASDGGIVIAF